MKTPIVVIITTAAALGLSACASSTHTPPESVLLVEKEITAMSRTQVISAVTECENSGMNALIIYGQRRVNGLPSHVVVDVTCVPTPRRLR